MIEPQRALRLARGITLLLALGLVGYGVLRFDVVQLPEGARSPLYGVHGGDRLLVDRRVRGGRLDAVVLFRARSGELLLGRVSTPPAEPAPALEAALRTGALWILSDRLDVPAPDSDELGPIPAEDVVGRVVLVLPW